MTHYLLINKSEGDRTNAETYRVFREWHDCRTAALEAGNWGPFMRGLFENPPIPGNATRIAGGPRNLDITAMTIEPE